MCSWNGYLRLALHTPHKVTPAIDSHLKFSFSSSCTYKLSNIHDFNLILTNAQKETLDQVKQKKKSFNAYRSKEGNRFYPCQVLRSIDSGSVEGFPKFTKSEHGKVSKCMYFNWEI